MPELPEVATFRKYLENHAIGRQIASVEVKDSRIVHGLPASELEKKLAGRKLISTRQHGKYLFAETDGAGWLIMHFGMTGYFKYFENSEDDPQYDRLLIRFSGGGFLSYVNQRMLGWVGLTGDPDELIAYRGLGRSAEDRRFGYREFRKIFSGRKSEIKSALMNQGLIAGIGNIYSDEILFQARIHPKRRANDLTEKELKSIFNNMKEVLRTATDRNADYGDLPEKYLLRERRKGAKCPVCETRLETAKVGGRTAYFCSKCQKGSEQ